MRGSGGPTTATKWSDINSQMKYNNIAVLALQETHSLTTAEIDSLNSQQGYQMNIIMSSNPEKPNAGGIALILNKYLTQWNEVSSENIIPGWALMISLPWNDNNILQILTVYAPNDWADNEKYWVELLNIWKTKKLPKPDIIMGDFNLVANAIDRHPAKHKHSGANDTLTEFLDITNTADAWCLENPTNQSFTWLKPPLGNIQSWID